MIINKHRKTLEKLRKTFLLYKRLKSLLYKSFLQIRKRKITVKFTKGKILDLVRCISIQPLFWLKIKWAESTILD